MTDKRDVRITVITVCYNAEKNIEETIQSVLGQTYPNVEYIIVDGNSTDGTHDIITGYLPRISRYIHENDKGVYDAMNKGVTLAEGDYIIMMNAGDTFVDRHTLEKAVGMFPDSADVIYGDSLEKNGNGDLLFMEAGADSSLLSKYPVYRHGASFVKREVHRRFLFDLSKRVEFGFALDYNQIWTMHRSGCRFEKIDIPVMIYEKEGMSADPLKSCKYQYLITGQGGKRNACSKIKFELRKIKIRIRANRRLNNILLLLYSFGEYLMNNLVGNTPFYSIRRRFFKLMGIKIGKGTVLNMKQYIMASRRLSVGEHTHINRGCILDARGGLKIGNNVSISHNVSLMTGSHDCYSRTFSGIYLPIRIEDNVWIGVGATVLNGIVLGEGSVVAAGAVVTRDVEPYKIVGGIPAKVIGERPKDLNYQCRWEQPFV